MLITIYNNEAKDSFQTNFKSNLILPKNCELKLTNAFISLAHRITIPADKTTFKISANDESSGTAHVVTISAGIYSLSALAKEFDSKIKGVVDTNKLSLEVDILYDSQKGYEQGALTFDIKALSLNANIYKNIPVETGEYATWVQNEDSTLINDSTAIIEFHNGVNHLGVSKLEDTSNTDVDSWAYLVENEEITFHKWLEPNQLGNVHQPPSIPASLEPYGALSIQDNGQNQNYWFGFTTGATNFTGITSNAFTEIEDLDNCPIVVLVMKVANGAAFPANSVHIYENTGSGLKEVGKKKTGFNHTDKLAITIQNGNDVIYWYRAHNGSKWKQIPIRGNEQRFTPAVGDAHNFAYAVYGANADDSRASASMKNFYGSFAEDATAEVNDFGQYWKWDWNGNGEQFGFEDPTYEKTSTGAELAEREFSNEAPVKVDGDTTLETYKTAPYINLMIDNLPINSYSDNNTDTTENELDMSKCIASIPRYDQNGRFTIGYNLMYNPVEANVIKLHNEHEINLSQLRFRLRQADGQIPQDLDQPMSFVLDFNGEK